MAPMDSSFSGSIRAPEPSSITRAIPSSAGASSTGCSDTTFSMRWSERRMIAVRCQSRRAVSVIRATARLTRRRAVRERSLSSPVAWPAVSMSWSWAKTKSLPAAKAVTTFSAVASSGR